MTRIEVWEQLSQNGPALSGLFEGDEPAARFWAETYAEEIRLRWSRRNVEGELTIVQTCLDGLEQGQAV